ncbi:hypothetical protein DH2020_003931 [Rehmannia glutinosa]|uniref:Uncharacterized protein n=1 Tax=Rehmannia glutinosa TaxID=99300 RepID=A0ABR0XN76_REHGL
MGSALETLCGQAYGAGQIDMLGVYMQRSWVILLSTSFLLMFMYIFAEPLLLLLGQSDDISRLAGKYSLWMIPQLFAYAVYFPISKFFWLLMLKFQWGIAGGALVLNASWWLLVVAQMIYIISGACGKAWTGFSWKAFENLWGFVRLSVASAVMLCLEIWYFTALILFAGYLKNAEVSVDALSICMNILGWTVMVSAGFNAAISVRVSNELGAAHPRSATFSVVVVVISSILMALLISITLLIFQKQDPSLFSKEWRFNGWQALVAYVNIACYYLFGVPLGLILGYTLKMGVQGIWYGMVVGTVVQTIILFWIVYKTNWNKEASIAAKRIKKWRGDPKDKENDLEK